MSESVTVVNCPNCEEAIEYDPEMIRVVRNGYDAQWICPKCGHKEKFENITLENSATFLRNNEPIRVFEQYEHHGLPMWVQKDLKGKHNEYCLCNSCAHWKPNTKDNCPIAQALFEFDKSHNIVSPVWGCAHFKEK